VPTRFVGREDELAVLRAICSATTPQAARRTATVALLVGEPGSGKSRLLTELLSDVGDLDAIVLNGYEPERQVPLSCAWALFRRLTSQPGGATLEELAFGPAAAARSVEPIHLFEAAHRALRAASSTTTIVVDDLHWVDDMSLALLHYVVRASATSEHGVRLVAAARPSSVAARFMEGCRRSVGSERVRELVLAPLSEADGVRLVRQIAPTSSERDARALWAAAGGSPFWMELLLAGQHGRATLAEEAIARMAPAGPDGVMLASLLAVVGRPLSPDDAAECLGWESGRADAVAEVLERSGVVLRDGETVAIVHDLIRREILDAMPAERMRRLHRHYGRWLEATAGDDAQQLLAALEHLHGARGDVLGLALRLATSSRRRILGAAGLERLSVVLDDADPTDARTAQLRWNVAALASELGDHEVALRRWAGCVAATPDPVEAGRASVEASAAAMSLALAHEAWRHLEQARRHSSADEALAVEVRAQEAELLWYLEHRPAEAQATAAAAVRGARALAAPAPHARRDDRVDRALLRSLRAATRSALTSDDPGAMLTFSDEMASIAAGTDDRMAAHAEVDAALALRAMGRNEEAAVRLRAAWLAVHQQVLPMSMLEVGAMLGNILLSLGRIDEAEAVSAECIALGTRLAEFSPSRALTVVLPHMIELSRGDWRTAVEGLRQSALAEPDAHYRHQAHRERAAALARLDPRHAAAEVRVAVEATLRDAELARCTRCLTESRATSAEALARIGDLDAADELIARTDRPAADAYNSLAVSRAEAVLSAARNEDRAVTALETVIADAEEQHLLLEALRVRLDLAAVLARRDRSLAADVLRRAAERAQRFGARTEQAAAEKALRSFGVRTWRRAAASPGDDALSRLSEREAQIARLVSQGATNPEIAAVTFVSRKTVERHVSNILAKLGLRNRAELAALVGEHVEHGAPGE
jgi:DNA-binding NarL/FixJ family response regulator